MQWNPQTAQLDPLVSVAPREALLVGETSGGAAPGGEGGVHTRPRPPGQGSPALGPGSSLQSVLCASSTGSKDSSGPSGSLGPRGNH